MSDAMWIADTETTGLSPESGHKLIEIGMVEVVDRVITGRNYHIYIDPGREVPDQAVAVHGMNRTDLVQLSGGKMFPDYIDEFLETVGDRPLVFHNAPFDLSFIDAELTLAGYQPLSERVPVFDTLVYANQLHPGKRNNLDALVSRYKVPSPDRSYHGALLDSEILADVYLAMTRQQTKLSFDSVQAQQANHKIEINIERIDASFSSRLTEVDVSREEHEDHLNYFKP